ncbi:hypothetical protein AS149_25435 [Burkholderia cenocepacia]|nr:hypothetical protein AS149_25435 [Burkholderia cenocepacia]
MWAIRNQHAEALDFEDHDAVRAAIRAAYDDGFNDAAKAGFFTKASALIGAWCEGAKFALRAIAKHDLCFLTDKMKLSAVNLATEACLKERERLSDGVAQDGDVTDNAVLLHAEIHRLRAKVQGPDGFDTWKDAALDERTRRIAAESKLAARKPSRASKSKKVGVPAWRKVSRAEHPAETQMREQFEAKYGDMSGVMKAVNQYCGIVERYRQGFGADTQNRVTNADLDTAEAALLANVRAEARWLCDMDEANAKRLAFVAEAQVTWYPGRVRDGSGRGVLGFDCHGTRAQATAMSMPEAIDLAMAIVQRNAPEQ